MFFVIAGFLTTNTLSTQLHKLGRIDAKLYLARLLSRLLPMVLLTVITISSLSLIFIPPWTRFKWKNDPIATSLFFENWELAGRSVDYWDQTLLRSPFQHFWAMSMQGQFYFIFLITFIIASKIVSKPKTSQALTAFFSIGFIASLSYSVWLTSRNQPFAHFNTGVRAWEFMAGALLALNAHRIKFASHRLAVVLNAVGLIMIVSYVFLFKEISYYPGYHAVWTVLATVTVIATSPKLLESSMQNTTAHFLSGRFAQYLGKISFPLYLIHWPTLVFFQAWTGQTRTLKIIPGLIVVLIATALAILATKLIDEPIRVRISQMKSPMRTLGVLVLGVALVICLAVSLSPSMSGDKNIVEQTRTASGLSVKASADGVSTVSSAEIENVRQRYVETAVNYQKCLEGEIKGSITLCEYGDSSSDTTVLLAGGSHVGQWFSAVRAIAADKHWRLLVAYRGGCRFTSESQEGSAPNKGCDEWSAGLLADTLKVKPDVLITTGTLTTPTTEIVPDGYVTMWEQIQELGTQVIVIRDNPRWTFNPIDCLWIHGKDPGQCSFDRNTSEVDVQQIISDKINKVNLIDMNGEICDGSQCNALKSGIITYFDDNHLATDFVLSVKESLAEKIARALSPNR